MRHLPFSLYCWYPLIVFFRFMIDARSDDEKHYKCAAEAWIRNGDTCYHVLARKTKWYETRNECLGVQAMTAFVDDLDDMVCGKSHIRVLLRSLLMIMFRPLHRML